MREAANERVEGCDGEHAGQADAEQEQGSGATTTEVSAAVDKLYEQ
jgi:hypothetical protein